MLLKLALVAAALGAAGLSLASPAVLASAQEARGPLRLAGILALAATALAALRFCADAAALAGGWPSILEPPYLDWTFEAQGAFLTLAAVGSALIVAGAVSGRRPVAAVGGLGVVLAFTTTGHVSAGAVWLRVALTVHLVGVAVWIAAPVLLWPRRAIDDAALLARVEAFSRVAAIVVPVALAAGGVLAVALLGELRALTGSGYGRMILVKMVAGAAALTLGAANMLWVAKELAADPARGRRLLRLTLGADAALFSAALVAVAAATTVLPPS